MAEVREDDLWGRITGQVMNSLSARKKELMNRLLGENRNVPGLYEVLALNQHHAGPDYPKSYGR
jgi:hypothetical protein